VDRAREGQDGLGSRLSNELHVPRAPPGAEM
jgi:hypothetical protein